mmetsp:Transcript_5338/g.14855  ORF Transcript_5338/g.14855 Transcript_5338/m.14855 type:complete len:271 (+) Transcript_5338:2846-3658(+)
MAKCRSLSPKNAPVTPGRNQNSPEPSSSCISFWRHVNLQLGLEPPFEPLATGSVPMKNMRLACWTEDSTRSCGSRLRPSPSTAGRGTESPRLPSDKRWLCSFPFSRKFRDWENSSGFVLEASDQNPMGLCMAATLLRGAEWDGADAMTACRMGMASSFRAATTSSVPSSPISFACSLWAEGQRCSARLPSCGERMMDRMAGLPTPGLRRLPQEHSCHQHCSYRAEDPAWCKAARPASCANDLMSFGSMFAPSRVTSRDRRSTRICQAYAL